ncbi:NUDIX family hydrolase, partial [Cutibacterium avidum TM16]
GVMALDLARRTGRIDQLRPADSPWPIRERPGGINGALAE